MTANIAIVGAGISGLAAAHYLVAAGYQVRVYESSSRAGGVVGAHRADGFVVERGASSFLPSPKGASALALELGVATEEAAASAPHRWIYVDRILHEVPMSAFELLASDLLSWRGKLRALVEPLQPTMPEAEESIADFCRRRLGREVGRTLVGPLVHGVFAGDIESLSLRACFPKLAELESRGGFVRGSAANKIEQLFARLQGAEVSDEPGRVIRAPVGGMDALVTSLADSLSESISYNTPIASVERGPSGLLLHDSEGDHHDCDALVLCSPGCVSAALLEPHSSDAAAALREIPYAPIAVVGLGFDVPLRHPLNGFGVVVAKGEVPAMLGAVFESSLWPGRAPEGMTLVRCMLAETLRSQPGAPELMEQSDAQLGASAMEGLRTTMGVEATPHFSKVTRWPFGIPQYTVGHLARVRRVKHELSRLGILLSSNVMGGISVNDCIAKGHRMVGRVERLLASSAVLLAVVIACATSIGCAASNKERVALSSVDGGLSGQAQQVDRPAETISEQTTAGTAIVGRVEIMARWLWPSSEYRRSLGRNACGGARSPDVQVEVMGGLLDVAVSSETGEAPGAALMSISQCAIRPRVVVVGVGQTLTVQNLDLGEATVIVEWVARLNNARGQAEAKPLAAQTLDGTLVPDPVRCCSDGKQQSPRRVLPFRVAGQRYAFDPARPGLLRLHTLADPGDVVYAVVSQGAAALTDERGYATLELEQGQHTISLWHAPIQGKPLSATVSVNVEGRRVGKKTVDISL